ncbi:hypothetical protein [Anabaena sp. UHCC 0204]|uniref:hypothetical protein n=1 Tax=Anabaena sp. UHCC 0204 TaxID=2590009 RepID=UPI00144759D2|nr:hypothetical protein [Anabaena sp. UHCC 0204]
MITTLFLPKPYQLKNQMVFGLIITNTAEFTPSVEMFHQNVCTRSRSESRLMLNF